MRMNRELKEVIFYIFIESFTMCGCNHKNKILIKILKAILDPGIFKF